MTPHVGRVALLRRLLLKPLHELRVGLWALVEVRRVRRDLRQHGTHAVVRPVPRRAPGRAGRGIHLAAKVSRATCLERSLLRQAWFVQHGRSVDVVIGVRRGGSIEAHAWVEGDDDSSAYTEIYRLPPAAS